MRLLTFSVFAALLSAPAFAADVGTYRPGTPYSSTVATGADVCDNQCSGDAQCRGWNYVKPNPSASGICEFLSSVSAPISSQISISGENHSAAPFYSGLSAGQTNTVRVGKPTLGNPVRVGEAPSNRRIVRQAPPKQIQTQQTSTRSVENMSLTAQQNRFRQGHMGVPQPAPRQTAPQMQRPQMQGPQFQGQRPVQGQRPMFRPILDGPAHQIQGQNMRQPQSQPTQRQASRRATGPRRLQGRGQGTAAPQFRNPGAYMPQQARQPVQQPQQRGQSRPPIGQPIPAPQAAARPQATPPIQAQPMTPSQRLAQLTAQTRTSSAPMTGPIALTPQEARTSLFGKLNDDVAIPTASAVPTQPIAEQALGEVLAGGR